MHAVTVMGEDASCRNSQAADDHAPLVFQAEQSVLLDLVELTGTGWARVTHRDGQGGYVKLSQFGRMKLAVLGAGAWGTAISISLSGATGSCCGCVTRSKCAKLPKHAPTSVTSWIQHSGGDCGDGGACGCHLKACESDIGGTATAGLRPTLRRLIAVGNTAPVVWLCKGFEAESAQLPHQIAASELAPTLRARCCQGRALPTEIAPACRRR